ncbi:MAG: hypothetical protein OXU72_10035, partial [Gammaproteobacteria bacterium]|nr:hypothetical protein [Rhodospirillaceae bacterium]MDE0063114.1 hypothetical protein [Gammaproteobacteria bacterium]
RRPRPARIRTRRTAMAPTTILPDHPVYAFCPEYGPPDRPQQIRIVFRDLPGYVPTALVALTLDDAECLCTKLNAPLGLNRDDWLALVARSMAEGEHRGNSSVH